MPIIPKAEPLFHKAGKKGVLLIHGFLGSPFEMKYLANRFIQNGFTVSVPRLPGHGTSLEDMARFTGSDWLGEENRPECDGSDTPCPAHADS